MKKWNSLYVYARFRKYLNQRFYIWLMFGVLCVVIAMQIISTGKHTSIYSEDFLRGLQGPIDVQDPELLTFIQNEILVPPSKEPYNLTNHLNRLEDELRSESEDFYLKHLKKIFKDKRDGFFVEAGALDGETMSNTLLLETQKGWTGLLVEVDEVSFKGLMTKHRKAWTANVCLSPDPYPSQELFEDAHNIPAVSKTVLPYKQRAMSRLTKFSNIQIMPMRNWDWVQCVPLQSLLLGLDIKWVDLLVLDIEGAELSVLKHFDLLGFNVQVLFLEWKKIHEIESIVDQLKGRGYVLIARYVEDLIFAKKGSPYEYYEA